MGTWTRFPYVDRNFRGLNSLLMPQDETLTFLPSLLRCEQRGAARVRRKSCRKPHITNRVRLFITGSHAVGQYGHRGLGEFEVTGLIGSAAWSLDCSRSLSIALTPDSWLDSCVWPQQNPPTLWYAGGDQHTPQCQTDMSSDATSLLTSFVSLNKRLSLLSRFSSLKERCCQPTVASSKDQVTS